MKVARWSLLTIGFTATFKDMAGDLVVPDWIKWTLTDKNKTVINSRTDVSIIPPASSVDIVLSGLDLALQTGETNLGERVLTIKAQYDSTEGTDLPLNGEIYFIIDDLLNIS